MPRVSPKTIVYSLGLLAALAFLMRSMQGPASRSAAGTSKKTAARETRSGSGKETATTRRVQAAPDNADLKRYQVVIARNLFALPAPPVERIKLPNPNLTIMREKGPIVIAPIKPGPVIPPTQSLDGWSYAGYYVMDGVTTAAIQNKNNTTVKFVARGDDFQGYKVESISGEQVVLTAGPTRVPLSRPSDFSVVPLQGMTAQPPGPGTPGGRAGMRMGLRGGG